MCALGIPAKMPAKINTWHIHESYNVGSSIRTGTETRVADDADPAAGSAVVEHRMVCILDDWRKKLT